MINIKKTAVLFSFLFIALNINAQSPVGVWKIISHTFVYDGQKIDSHAALLKQRPCAAQIVWEINTDGTFRLNATTSGCEDSYKKIQEKLYSKTQWKYVKNIFTTSATNFTVGQSYTVVFSGKKMIMTGTEGQGTIIYQKL